MNLFFSSLGRLLLAPDANIEGSSPSPDANAGASSTPTDETLESVISDVVKASVAKESETSASSPDKQEPEKPLETEEPSSEAPEDTEKPEPTEEEVAAAAAEKAAADAQLPFHKHPRWKEVTTENKTLREEVQKLKTDLEPLKRDAAVAANLRNWAQQNRLSNEDVNRALGMAALSVTDPKAFRAQMGEYLESLDIVAGAKLPTDLAKKVEDGVISEEDAKELAQARIENARLKQSREQTANAQAQSREEEVTGALETWEKLQQKSDTGYSVRREDFYNALTIEMQRNFPTSAADANKLANKVYADVKARHKKYQPAPPPRKQLPSNGSSSTSGEDIGVMETMGDLYKIIPGVLAKHK